MVHQALIEGFEIGWYWKLLSADNTNDLVLITESIKQLEKKF